MPRPKTKVDPEVAGHAKGEFNIDEGQICPKHNTYKNNGFCKVCVREKDPEYQVQVGERGMTAEESAYVRKHRGGGKNPDEVLQKFRKMKEADNG